MFVPPLHLVSVSAMAMMASSKDALSREAIGHHRPRVTTIIFDVDDTLYDVGTGFTTHRLDGATSFMVDKLRFPSREEAQILRDDYFERHHSISKALAAAEAEGRLPSLIEGEALPPGRTTLFDPADLDEYWATNLDFAMLGGPDPRLLEALRAVSDDPDWNLTLVAFSNGPRRYVSRTLREIGLDSFFPPDKLFAVTDVLPHCKPDKGSFDVVLGVLGARAEECVMVEDSLKNIRAAKELGMRTIFVAGRGRRRGGSTGEDEQDVRSDQNEKGAGGTRPGDSPNETDPAVDAVVEVASEIGSVLKMWLG